MDPAVDDAGLSTTAKCVLGLAGLSLVLIVAYLGLTLYRAAVWISSLLSTSTGKPLPVPRAKAPKAPANGGASDSDTQALEPRGKDLRALIKESKKEQSKKSSGKDDQASHHELFLNTLKGHADVVHGISWSSDGMCLATACEDMYIRLFDVADVTNREPKFRRIRTPKIPLGVGFGDGPDTVAVLMRGIPDAIVALYTGKGSTTDASPWDQQWLVDNVHGKEQPLALRSAASNAAANTAGAIVALSTKKDARVYNLQGRELAILEPNSLGNFELAMSQDGRFVSVATFTADVKIWELKYSRENREFKSAFKAMDLKGHKRSVQSVAFSPDSKRVATASQDGTLRVWNIDVRYNMSEDAKPLLTIAMAVPAGKCYQHLAFGPRGVLAASLEGKVHLINTASSNGELLASIDAHDGAITAMAWGPKLLKGPKGEAIVVLATASRDKRVRLWRSPVGQPN